MKSIIRPLGVSLVLGCATAAFAQTTGPKIDRVDIKFVGPSSISEDFIRSNIKLKSGQTYMPGLTQDDVHSLYGTGQFYNIRISVDPADDGGVVLTYTVQARPRITEIKFEGNDKLSDNKLKKKVTVKVGEALDEQKLFSNVQEMKKLYEKSGLADTKVKYVLNIDEATGHGTVVFHVEESPKVKITDVEFIGAKDFPQKTLRKTLKTQRRWMFSWITGSGYLVQDDFDGDRDILSDYYRNHGYLDFQIKEVKLDHPAPGKLVIKYFVDEGQQYKVGSVKFTGAKIYTDPEIFKGLVDIHNFQHLKGKLGPNGLPMDVGDVFTPDGLGKDSDSVEDFYGSKGYIDISQGTALHTLRVPNVDKGTMDLEFQFDDSQKSYVQKVEIRGNLRTKDKVIRRELAISPGDVFDMVRVKISKERLDGLQYFEKVDTSPEPTDPPINGKKNLIINVAEQNTGNFSIGAGFSSVDSLVGYAEVSQGNFDLFHPPYFTGGGEKIRLRVQLGTERQDYELSFVEPWFLNRKLSLGVDLYRHQLDFESPNNIFDETRTGVRLSLTRALGSDFLIGSVNYTIEDVGITLNDPWHGPQLDSSFHPVLNNLAPNAILNEQGDQLYQRFGGSLAYDTRNSVKLPNHGQRTELTGEFDVGDKQYYKLELHTSWYWPGLFKGHVIEAGGRAGIADSLSGGDVPFYDRYYLGGLYSLRGFKFRNIAPREVNLAADPTGHSYFDEPIGGDSYWFGSVEYSVPILEKDAGPSLRVAMFYDIGAVSSGAYSFDGSYLDNWGLGIRLDIPHLGPLRLDYGIPITTDKFNGTGGKFQFGVGYTRDF
ncbi:MAG TPA: outer membrane protein assembly factor BamA [Verrucomicrobiae bacterium]|nr:outer membrane protein assembly factor BamA [Verrucomicrobiae bacterium]